jgi:hypothetical protein
MRGRHAKPASASRARKLGVASIGKGAPHRQSVLAASLATPAPDRATIAPLLYTPSPARSGRPAWQDPRWQSAGIVAVLSAIVIAFQ